MPDIETAPEGESQSAESAIEHELVAVENFLGYVRGEVISEAQKVLDLLQGEWQQYVVKRLKNA